jgi:hypothetical protein
VTVPDVTAPGVTAGAAIGRLDTAAAVAGLPALPPEAVRGFFGLDPVTQNDALLAKEIDRTGVQLYSCGETLLGCLPNPDHPRQAQVASTSSDPEPLRALLGFLGTYQRCTSFVAQVPQDSPVAAAFESCGFARVGILPEHLFHSGRYRDVLIYHATMGDTCLS